MRVAAPMSKAKKLSEFLHKDVRYKGWWSLQKEVLRKMGMVTHAYWHDAPRLLDGHCSVQPETAYWCAEKGRNNHL
jgi:hypothetical protein